MPGRSSTWLRAAPRPSRRDPRSDIWSLAWCSTNCSSAQSAPSATRASSARNPGGGRPHPAPASPRAASSAREVLEGPAGRVEDARHTWRAFPGQRLPRASIAQLAPHGILRSAAARKSAPSELVAVADNWEDASTTSTTATSGRGSAASAKRPPAAKRTSASRFRPQRGLEAFLQHDRPAATPR